MLWHKHVEHLGNIIKLLWVIVSIKMFISVRPGTYQPLSKILTQCCSASRLCEVRCLSGTLTGAFSSAGCSQRESEACACLTLCLMDMFLCLLSSHGDGWRAEAAGGLDQWERCIWDELPPFSDELHVSVWKTGGAGRCQYIYPDIHPYSWGTQSVVSIATASLPSVHKLKQ